MPSYDYMCEECGLVEEFMHPMSANPVYKCPKCQKDMVRQISSTFHVATAYHASPTMADRKEMDHTKKVKDLDRAVRRRRKLFGGSEVGVPVDKPDPRHIIKRGKTLGGQELNVDKKEFIQAAAKDPTTVAAAEKALKTSQSAKKSG